MVSARHEDHCASGSSAKLSRSTLLRAHPASRVLREPGIVLDRFLELAKEEREVIIGQDCDAAAATWTLANTWCPINGILCLKEKHAKHAGDLIFTPKHTLSRTGLSLPSVRRGFGKNGTEIDEVDFTLRTPSIHTVSPSRHGGGDAIRKTLRSTDKAMLGIMTWTSGKL